MLKARCTFEIAVLLIKPTVFFVDVLVAVALLPILKRDDSKRRFQAQLFVAMLEQCCNH